MVCALAHIDRQDLQSTVINADGSRCSDGISATQGGHQVAQKLTSTTFAAQFAEIDRAAAQARHRSAGAARSFPGGAQQFAVLRFVRCPGLAVQWCRLRRCSAIAVEHVHRLVSIPGNRRVIATSASSKLRVGRKAVCHVRETVQKYRAAALLQLFDVARRAETSRILRLEQVYRQVLALAIGRYSASSHLRCSHEQPRADRHQAPASCRRESPTASGARHSARRATLRPRLQKYLFAAACDGVVEQRRRSLPGRRRSGCIARPAGTRAACRSGSHASTPRWAGTSASAVRRVCCRNSADSQRISRSPVALIDLYRNLVAAGVDDKVLRALAPALCEQ